MSERQEIVNRIRKLIRDVKVIREVPVTKEVERFMLEEALKNLETAEKHLKGYLQVDKYHGN